MATMTDKDRQENWGKISSLLEVIARRKEADKEFDSMYITLKDEQRLVMQKQMELKAEMDKKGGKELMVRCCNEAIELIGKLLKQDTTTLHEDVQLEDVLSILRKIKGVANAL
jgi:hypothetical protein